MTGEVLYSDVVIVGAGAAGLVTALEAAPKEVILLAKAPVGEGSSSAWAQGGIAAAVGPGDHPHHHRQDTLRVGVGIVDEEAARVLSEEGPAIIDALLNWGMQFDRDASGEISLGREAAHSHRRILHAQGDSTGKELMRALGQAVLGDERIRQFDDLTGFDLIKDGERVIGVCANRPDGSVQAIYADHVVLATGGVGSLFGETTNPAQSRGEGLAMAAQAGARLSDLEFVQFHPSAMDLGVTPMPLASEALRGEGSHLIDGRGVRFMPAVHADAELAPRDVVARAIWRRVKNGEKVFLDCTKAVGESFPDRFPTVWGYCQAQGVDPRREPIPIKPAAHYHMGGVATDQYGRTCVDGLWAVGEVACTGVHGANRLASNSLLEAAVYGRRAGRMIASHHGGFEPTFKKVFPVSGGLDLSDQLSRLMYQACGVERHEEGLRTALMQVQSWSQSSAAFSAHFKNLLCVARMILTCALARKESRGGHFRSDYPETDAKQARRTSYTLDEINDMTTGLLAKSTNKGTETEWKTQA